MLSKTGKWPTVMVKSPYVADVYLNSVGVGAVKCFFSICMSVFSAYLV